MRWVEDDGGRTAAGFRGLAGDCCVRAIAIAEPADYREVYDSLTATTEAWAKAHPRARAARGIGRKGPSPRDGVYHSVARVFLLSRGWTWHPTMQFGVGTTVHLRDGELPAEGRLIAQVSKHWTAIIDGVIHDNHDPSRDGTRAVYGYWTRT